MTGWRGVAFLLAGMGAGAAIATVCAVVLLWTQQSKIPENTEFPGLVLTDTEAPYVPVVAPPDPDEAPAARPPGLSPVFLFRYGALHWVAYRGDVRVRGTMDRETVRRVLALSMPEVSRCLGENLLRPTPPTAPGGMAEARAEITVSAAAFVTKATLYETGGLKGRRCIEKALKKLRFPKSDGAGIHIIDFGILFGLHSGDQPPEPGR